MSTMLEQAIIDAAALRETAMKSAEKSVIEKYSKEFKDTFDKLLEQEMQQPPADPTADPAASAAPADPNAQAGQEEPIEDPMDDMGGTDLEPEKKNVFDKVKTAFFELDGEDDELITINFDGLKAKKVGGSALLASPPTGLTSEPPAAAPAPEATASLEESLDLDLEELKEEIHVALGEMYGARGGADSYHGSSAGEEELEFDELDEFNDPGEGGEDPQQSQIDALQATQNAASTDAAAKREQAAKRQGDADRATAQLRKLRSNNNDSGGIKPPAGVYTEEIELTEEELKELEESLTVDMKNVPDGYMGTHDEKNRRFRKVALAAARGDKQRKRREKAKKSIGDLDLQEAVQKIGTKYIKEKERTESLNKENKKLVSVLETLKEQLEQINLSNAKLLYTNKVLSNVSLNERQKQQVVENIAKAGNVVEAKAIYETLQSTVQSVNKEKMPKSLSEALNRGPSPFLVRKRETNSLDDVMTERMRRLAGIKTNSN